MRQPLHLFRSVAIASVLSLAPAAYAAAALDIPTAPRAGSAADKLPHEDAPFSGYLLRQRPVDALAGPAFPSGSGAPRSFPGSHPSSPDTAAELFGSGTTGRMMQTLLADAARHQPASVRRPPAIAPVVRPVRPIASAHIGPHLTIGFVWQR